MSTRVAVNTRRPAARGKGKARQGSTIDRLLERLPISHDLLRRLATWSILTVIAAMVLAMLVWMDVPAMIGAAMAEEAGRAGLRVEQVEITGLHHMDRMTVYAAALDQKSRAMPLVDLAGVRRKLLGYGWVQDAHVSRRLPDTLLVHIVERTPAAIWQHGGTLSLIDASGVALDAVSPDAMPELPLVIGPGADQQEPAYRRLIAAAPTLARQVRAATWVGNRRWDLMFASGETLALPEGDADAVRALRLFAEMASTQRLLGRGWLRFDLRDPAKLVARKPGAVHDRAVTDPGVTGGNVTSTKPIADGAAPVQGQERG